MKTSKNPIARLGAWLGLTLSSVIATKAADVPASVVAEHFGSVEGRVLNLSNGQYLNNARITVDGSSLETFTDSSGRFRLDGVPAGQRSIRVFYSGFPAHIVTVVVAAGATATQDFNFGASDESGGKVTVLDAFLVASTRETNARNIATNEQRFASNIKNVVAADAFGDATEGNVGEIMKYLPGVTIDYIASEATSISVRGFGGEFTSITADGARMPSGMRTPDRTFELQHASINNISRVEVTKVPTPSMSADTLGGSVNLVSRSAFESSRTEFKYRTYLSMNSDETHVFKKTPGPADRASYKVLPGLDFNYIAPLTENFGIVINGLVSSKFNAQNAQRSIWVFTGAVATPAAPYLRQYSMLPGPKNIFRNSLSLQADWRPARGHVISVGAQWNYYHTFFQALNHLINVGAAAPQSFGPDFTYGAPGGSVIQEGISYDAYSGMVGANISHRFTGRTW
ncbi:MAG: TonB-dependent receptor plug domain-containing protein, partial [Opitutaceae bacterium]